MAGWSDRLTVSCVVGRNYRPIGLSFENNAKVTEMRNEPFADESNVEIKSGAASRE